MFLKRGLVLVVMLAALMVLPAAAQNTSVYITTQRFDTGLMIWRSDNHTIYVLGSSGSALTFPSTAYAALPDNPIFGNPPSKLHPIFGFGKVWGNQRNVRDLIGWPTLPEIGFETSILVQNATLFITELDGSVLQINPDGTWHRIHAPADPTPTPTICPHPFFFGMPTGDVCPGAPTTTSAAYQPYERGFMVWLADRGDVWVFVNAASPGGRAHWLHFAEGDYRDFADAAPQTPPPGKIQPISGFGRVWYNLPGYGSQKLSAELGWATAPESSYSATWQVFGRVSHVHTYLSLPDGRVADVYQGLAGLNWTWAK